MRRPREQLGHHRAELDGLGLDFYCLSENVHRTRHKVFGEESPTGKTWTDAGLHTFNHAGCEAAWQQRPMSEVLANLNRDRSLAPPKGLTTPRDGRYRDMAAWPWYNQYFKKSRRF